MKIGDGTAPSPAATSSAADLEALPQRLGDADSSPPGKSGLQRILDWLNDPAGAPYVLISTGELPGPASRGEPSPPASRSGQ